MVRTYKKKSNASKTSAELMKQAVHEVVVKEKSIRQISTDFSISRTTLRRYVNEARAKGFEKVNSFAKTKAHRNVFSQHEEDQLADYLKLASRQHHGLTKKMTRELALEYAKRNNKNYQESWDRNGLAGIDWIDGFMKHQSSLSVRKPEPTSLSRGTSFNKSNVNAFFDNLEALIGKYRFLPADIYNVDETALTTVHRPPKVIAEKSLRQVGQVTSAERGTLVTMIGAANVQGRSVPPMLISPRVHCKAYMVSGAPPRTIGVANPSGWISRDIFLQWLKHLIHHSRASKDRPILVIMDNHDSHCTLEGIDLAKNNSIILLTFPPHCSHRLQPLDLTVFGPLKVYYNEACNSWQLNYPGQSITIYNIPALLDASFSRAFNPETIKSGFCRPGIVPFNRNVFSDADFLCANVTNRADPTSTETPATPISSTEAPSASSLPVTPTLLLPAPTQPSATSCSSVSALAITSIVSPEEIRPYAKAGPRKNAAINRKRKKTAILTETPVKMAIEAEEKAKAEKKKKTKKSAT
ncbi:uncharacterized protein [Watersipora subatra]|uniref:uncharacterized protein n=1 Tax=Watersipora subatra TaxID=2589382 RepID=UPI00355C427E